MKPIRAFLLLWALLGAAACGGGDSGGSATNDTSACGDGIVTAGEICDDGNDVEEDDCTNQCQVRRCGDGLVQPGETCDDGNLDNSDACTTECREPACGDGFVQAGEDCDDGNLVSHDGCLATCELAACGDGTVWVGVEACDDGNQDETDGCLRNCTLPNCGDGVVQTGEACDDGNANNADACLSTCQIAFCGDGHVQATIEACDDGNRDDNDGCTNDCSLPRCGDGILQIGVEGCDDGNQNDADGCTRLCQLESCGDGLVQAGESCDDGNRVDTDDCLSTCQLPFCGDGWLRPASEECDDGNRDDHDGCTTACTVSRCGDGIVQPPEACDDGNATETDACLSTCTAATCGDAFVQVGVETCDDGNALDTDACLSTCEPARCGDGQVWTGYEACDDGNSIDGDACRSDCAWPTCGDGLLAQGEECDDGNLDNTDGCLVVCLEHDFCEGFAVTAVTPPLACLSASPPSLTLTASGEGFLVIEGREPEVSFDGASAPVTLVTDCAPLGGLLADVQSCQTLTFDLPPALGLGTYEIVVRNPITQECPATSSFSMAASPTLDSVSPNLFCAGRPLSLALSGSAFVPSTEVELSGGVVPTSTSFVDSTSLVASFSPLTAGLYDVTVSNGSACTDTLPTELEIVPQPRVFFVDPPVVYNGLSVQSTLYVSGINGGNVVSAAIRPSGTLLPYEPLGFTYDPTHPNRVQVVIPSGLDVGAWDVSVVDSVTCTAELPAGLNVVDDTALTLALERIVPPFGHTATRTGVTLYATSPPPSGQTGFAPVPAVYLNPQNPGPGALAARLSSTSFLSEAKINAVVPAGLPPGDYDVIVVNPDGTVGLLTPPEGFTITLDPPPVIDAISPVSVPNNAPIRVTVFGSGFSSPTVELHCQNSTTAVTVAVDSATATTIVTTVPADQLAIGSVCILRVTNDDGSYAEFSALGATEPAENLMDTTPDPALNVGRRAPAVVIGRAHESSTHLYVLGGDDGTVAGALDSIEVSPVDAFGELGAWRLLRQSLPTPLTLARAEVLGRHLFVVGGNSGSGPVAEVWRSEILDPRDAPVVTDVSLDLAAAGLGAGLWYFRVSAVLGAGDPDNPGGETLPSDPQPILVPAGLPDPLAVTVYFSQVSGATAYRIYRSPVSGAPVGAEELVDVLVAPATHYTDTGLATDPTERPLTIGDLGVWTSMPSLAVPREGFGLARAPDPADPDLAYLYAIAGRTTGNAVVGSYELLPLEVATALPPSAASWTVDAANPLPGSPRWQLGAFVVDQIATTRVTPGDTWIYAGSGANAPATMVETDFEAALVLPGGVLDTWLVVDPLMSLFAGYGYAAVANQLWVFGGQNMTPDDRCRATQLCGGLVTCAGPPTDPPDLQNWDAGFQFSVPRYLLGSAVGHGRIYLVGGLTTGGVLTPTVESTVW